MTDNIPWEANGFVPSVSCASPRSQQPSRVECVAVTIPAGTGAPALLASARPRIAVILTEYTPSSHADVWVTALLEGYVNGQRRTPSLYIVSMYTDQVRNWDVTSNLANTRAVHASFAGTVNPVPLINQPLVPDRNWPGGFRRIRAD
jgi:hypothetical protein